MSLSDLAELTGAESASEERNRGRSGWNWGEILPDLTMGATLRVRAERQRQIRFDEARPGNNESFSLSRIRVHWRW